MTSSLFVEWALRVGAYIDALYHPGVARKLRSGPPSRHRRLRTDPLVALLGVLEAVCAFAPIDPVLPAARLRHFLEHIEPAWERLTLAQAVRQNAMTCRSPPEPVGRPSGDGGELRSVRRQRRAL